MCHWGNPVARAFARTHFATVCHAVLDKNRRLARTSACRSTIFFRDTAWMSLLSEVPAVSESPWGLRGGQDTCGCETEFPGSVALTKPEHIQTIPELLNHLPLSISKVCTFHRKSCVKFIGILGETPCSPDAGKLDGDGHCLGRPFRSGPVTGPELN